MVIMPYDFYFQNDFENLVKKLFKAKLFLISGRGKINLVPFFLVSFSLINISSLKCQGRTR